jgi:hypothetical protein
MAFGTTDNLQNHGPINREMFTFDFKEGENSIATTKFSWWKTHLLINIITWGILVDFPIIIARYFKTHKWYITVHGTCLTLIIVASLFAEIAMAY